MAQAVEDWDRQMCGHAVGMWERHFQVGGKRVELRRRAGRSGLRRGLDSKVCSRGVVGSLPCSSWRQVYVLGNKIQVLLPAPTTKGLAVHAAIRTRGLEISVAAWPRDWVTGCRKRSRIERQAIREFVARTSLRKWVSAASDTAIGARSRQKVRSQSPKAAGDSIQDCTQLI